MYSRKWTADLWYYGSLRKTKYWGEEHSSRAWAFSNHGHWKSFWLYRSNFISWIKLLLNSQQSCVINAGNTISYFNLEKDARQGDSTYLFILALEGYFYFYPVHFIFIQSNENINGIETYKHIFLWTTYADDSTFLLRDITSVKELINH